MGSSVQTVFGNSLHSFLGTLIGTSWHFLSGTLLHFVLGTCFYLSPSERTERNISPYGNATEDAFTEAVSAALNISRSSEGVLLPPSGVLGWLPLLAVTLFLFLGNVGYGTLIWVVTAELLPPKV